MTRVEVDIEGYVAGWRRRLAERRRLSEERALCARSRLRAVADVLREHGATRIVVFGSLTDGSFGEHSDVDIAVSGLGLDLFQAWDDAQQALGKDIRLDLVPIDQASAGVRAAIERGEVSLP